MLAYRGGMKITDITGYPVFAGRRNYLFVEVQTDEGIWFEEQRPA